MTLSTTAIINYATTTAVPDVPLDDDTGLWNTEDNMSEGEMIALGLSSDGSWGDN